jgi:hypothetical protein
MILLELVNLTFGFKLNSKKMSEVIQQRDYSTWPKLIVDLKTNDNNEKIYRGQSNEYRISEKAGVNRIFRERLTTDEIDFRSWPLISSFDRYYYGRFYEFHTYLSQQFEDNNFKSRFGKHNFLEIFYLKDCCLLERLYYLQHYGIPTCFLDFSHDPLIALFFAISQVRASSVYSVDKEEMPLIHPVGVKISLFELNFKTISELLNIKNVQKDFSFMNYYEYKIKYVHFAFDIFPIKNCQLNTLNDNMKRQKGCFILFDNNGSQFALDQFLKREIYDTDLNDPLIVEYRLEYNEIFKRYDIEDLKNITLYDYLELHDISIWRN